MKNALGSHNGRYLPDWTGLGFQSNRSRTVIAVNSGAEDKINQRSINISELWEIKRLESVFVSLNYVVAWRYSLLVDNIVVVTHKCYWSVPLGIDQDLLCCYVIT